jgi:hypothetical protein
LFSDLLLVADKDRVCKVLVSLRGATIVHNVEGPPDFLIGFTLENGNDHQVTLEFSTKELKESWLNDIAAEIGRLTDESHVVCRCRH